MPSHVSLQGQKIDHQNCCMPLQRLDYWYSPYTPSLAMLHLMVLQMQWMATTIKASIFIVLNNLSNICVYHVYHVTTLTTALQGTYDFSNLTNKHTDVLLTKAKTKQVQYRGKQYRGLNKTDICSSPILSCGAKRSKLVGKLCFTKSSWEPGWFIFLVCCS